MIKLVNGLITDKYTEVIHEENFKHGAPNKFQVRKSGKEGDPIATIKFQEGPIKECGVNGVANEDLIAMVLCRLEHFNNGKYACKENQMAINKLEETLMWLRKRTNSRLNRGVEGTSEV